MNAWKKVLKNAVLVSIVIQFSLQATELLSIGRIKGTVFDGHTRRPLVGVNVYVTNLKRGAVTDANGGYLIDNIHEGVYTVRFSYVGYATVIKTIKLEEGDIEVDVMLQQSVLQLPTVSVTAKPQATDALHSPQSVSSREGRELESFRGSTLGESMKDLPGVSLLSTGSGILKPVVRGLTSQRVVVINDGVRQEGQQWADEHGPEIDASDVQRIEVVRGPGSVLYGSDALGGVVNVVKPELSVREDGSSVLASKIQSHYSTNNRQVGGAFTLDGATGRVGYRAHLSLRKGGNLKTPRGVLHNTGVEELNGAARVGYRTDHSGISIDFSHVGSKLEILEDPNEDPYATPYQRVIHDRISLQTNLTLEGVRFEAIGAFQQNWRREWEEADEPEPLLELISPTATLDVKAHHRPVGSLFGTVGISFLRQEVDSRRENRLLPNSLTNNYAVFVFEELHTSSLVVSGGLRFDSRSVDVKTSDVLNVAGQKRSYSALTGSVGAVYRPVEPLAIAVNLAHGWRAPTTFELFADGVHEGTATYEIGNSALLPERAWNLDAAIRYITPHLMLEVSVFQNTIQDYIFPRPTGQFDSVSTFQIYRYGQASATLVGGEITAKAQLKPWIAVTIGADLIRGTNNETGASLPRIPAPRMMAGIRLQNGEWGIFQRSYVELNVKYTSAQRRIDPLESETSEYTLVDVATGFDISLAQQQGTIAVLS